MSVKRFQHKPNLTFDEAVQVWLLHFDGWIQSDIAAYFPTNFGRITDILKERKHTGSRQAAMSKHSA